MIKEYCKFPKSFFFCCLQSQECSTTQNSIQYLWLSLNSDFECINLPNIQVFKFLAYTLGPEEAVRKALPKIDSKDFAGCKIIFIDPHKSQCFSTQRIFYILTFYIPDTALHSFHEKLMLVFKVPTLAISMDQKGHFRALPFQQHRSTPAINHFHLCWMIFQFLAHLSGGFFLILFYWVD